MQTYKLSDPNLSADILQTFHYRKGQRVAHIDSKESGVIIDGIRKDSGRGVYHETYWVKLDKDGGVVSWALSEIISS